MTDDRQPAAAGRDGPSDRRGPSRRRTRLRSGKIVTLDGQFLVECHFHDLADGGARIHPVAPLEVPDRFLVFDDFERVATYAEVVWRDAAGMGVRFGEPPQRLLPDRQRYAYLARKFYGV